LTENKSDTSRTGVDDSMHSLGTAVETLRRATAHLGLIRAIAIQSRNDRVGNLLD
jgi:hypothetical protein